MIMFGVCGMSSALANSHAPATVQQNARVHVNALHATCVHSS
jgi:hypothetical protein